jgi:beta-galactosidase
VEEVDSLPDGMQNCLEFCTPELWNQPEEVGMFCEVLRTTGARMVARYTQDFYAGKPAITQNRYGKGQVIYMGTVGKDRFYGRLAGWLSGLAGIRSPLEAPEGVEIMERWQGERRLLFVLNHSALEQTIAFPGGYFDLLEEKALSGQETLAPYGVLIATSQKQGHRGVDDPGRLLGG